MWLSGSNSVVECDLAKVEVAGSNPVSRSSFLPCPDEVSMKKRSCSLVAVVFALTIALFACGDSRSLQSVSVSPTAAKSSAQFTAMGMYNKSPTNIDITTATTWCIGASSVGSSSGACVGNINAGATVNSGTAQCVSGFTGSVTILAGQSGSSAMADTGSQLKPFGAAQLTCP